MQPGLLIAGVLVTVVVLAALQQELRLSLNPSPAGASVAAGAAAPPARPRPEPQVAAPAPVRVAAPAPEAVTPAPTPAAAPTAAPVAPPPEPDIRSGERRYASTWVNVRARPSSQAPVLRILSPGDSVTVDSLRQGWYRAEVEGETLGYVDRTLVSAAPVPRSP